ncbi:hypothetical protein C8R44DRAFT_886981 [Mycena epipterygia]|nr:hypothetical protein C8R44DRAFT_886981 [Mycena epipterygia]
MLLRALRPSRSPRILVLSRFHTPHMRFASRTVTHTFKLADTGEGETLIQVGSSSRPSNSEAMIGSIHPFHFGIDLWVGFAMNIFTNVVLTVLTLVGYSRSARGITGGVQSESHRRYSTAITLI